MFERAFLSLNSNFFMRMMTNEKDIMRQAKQCENNPIIVNE